MWGTEASHPFLGAASRHDIIFEVLLVIVVVVVVICFGPDLAHGFLNLGSHGRSAHMRCGGRKDLASTVLTNASSRYAFAWRW